MKNTRILVVEDNPLNRRLMHDVLEISGYQVFEAESVDEGREQLRLTRPEIVLMDIGLPGGGGELLLREMRADPEWASLPVIAVTAQAMHGDRERLIQAGFDGYLSKPINTRTFCQDIETMREAAANRRR